MVLVSLEAATAQTCGGKAGALGVLLRAGLPVPGGVVVPFAAAAAAAETDAVAAAEAVAGTEAVAAAGAETATEAGVVAATRAATETAPGAATRAATETAPGAATRTATEAAAGAATSAATETAAGAATRTATEAAAGAATRTATEAAPGAATRAATEAAAGAATRTATEAAAGAATSAATETAAGAATRAATSTNVGAEANARAGCQCPPVGWGPSRTGRGVTPVANDVAPAGGPHDPHDEPPPTHHHHPHDEPPPTHHHHPHDEPPATHHHHPHDEPPATHHHPQDEPPTGHLLAALGAALAVMGDPPVAVRSSASDEDTEHASAAGQHETVLAVRGAAAVAEAVRACWASARSARATAYRDGAPAPAMAVIVQRLVDAEVSGVLFTPGRPDGPTLIEASWGLGASVVGGTVTPDTCTVTADGEVTQVVGDKRTRLDRDGAGTGLAVRDVPADERSRPALTDAAARELAALGARAAALLGGPQDVEWAIAGGRVWLLQSRPVTAALPPRPAARPTRPSTLAGTPGSAGTATGPARVLHGPADFARMRAGDVLVCRYTDPAWTPLLRLAAGVVTETGGVLAHAAIVARELRIPAVVGVAGATTRLRDGAVVTVDGDAGTVDGDAGTLDGGTGTVTTTRE